ncbi:MAG: urease accessory protein UreE [Pseudomonadota bacterium]
MTHPSGRRISTEAVETVDTLTLDYTGRYRRRGVLTCEGGLTFLLDLPEATELRGAVLLEDGRAVAIEAAPEPLAEIRGDGLTRLAWHIGNRHTPCQVAEDRLLIQRDHVLEAMLRGLGAEITHVEEPFQPEGGAYGHGRTHGHSYSHDPHADPNAAIRADPAHE